MLAIWLYTFVHRDRQGENIWVKCLGFQNFGTKTGRQKVACARPPPYKIIRETKYDLSKSFLVLLAHCTSILTSFEGGNPSWKIDKVNLTYWVAVVGNSRNLSNSPMLDFANSALATTRKQTFVILHYFSLFGNIEHCVNPLRETAHFLFENSSSDCSE